MKKLNIKEAQKLVQMAIDEDLGKGDATSELLFPEDASGQATIVTREEIVVCGMPVIEEVIRQYDPRLTLKILIKDGQVAHVGNKLGILEGPLRSLLSIERIALNFMQRLSGIATTTSKYVRAIRGTKAKIYDTRKTLPGWRTLEKYAVRCGGGYNHRHGLYDGVLIKDNHLAEFGRSFPAKLKRLIEKARAFDSLQFIAVEVDHVDHQLNHVLKIPGVDIVLLDNMGQWQLKHAVEMRDEMCGKNAPPLLEASGNITLDSVSAVAQCGVERIAIGAITHSAKAVDIGLDR